MQTVIKGKRYDTETATLICELPCDLPPMDFHWSKTTLYRSPKGAFFVCVNNSFASLFGKEGIRIELVDRYKAWAIAESANLSPDEMQAAGFVPEAG